MQRSYTPLVFPDVRDVSPHLGRPAIPTVIPFEYPPWEKSFPLQSHLGAKRKVAPKLPPLSLRARPPRNLWK